MNQNTEHNNGFSTPNGYFIGLNQKIMANIKGEESSGFIVPENYFDQLNQHILARNTPKTQIIPLYKKPFAKWVSAIAASLVLVFSFFWFKPNSTGNQISNLTDEEIIKHLEDVGYQVDMLCDAGWCNELKKPENNLDDEILDRVSESVLMEELSL